MTADTEREVVIVQNADVFLVEEEDVLNRREGKGEVPADADITGLSRPRCSGSRCVEIDGQFFVHKGAWRAKRDLVDRLNPFRSPCVLSRSMMRPCCHR
jgi:hypothetical protein